MNHLLDEIFNDARYSGKVNLLQVLISYEKVIQARRISYYSDEGVEVYQALLRWGREKPFTEKKKDLPSESSGLQVTDLFAEPVQESLPIKTKKPLESHFQPLPKSSHLNPIKTPSKPLTSNQILAEAFASRSLKIRVFLLWIEAHNFSLHEKLAELKTLEKKKKNSKAFKFFSNLLLKKTLQGWTRFNLSQLKKKIARHLFRSNKLKTFWKAWSDFHRKNEILNGLKFTASFIHSQWLVKKTLIALTRHVHSQMLIKLKTHRVKERICFNLAQKSLNSWKIFVNFRLKSKILQLRSMKLRPEILKKRGFFQFFIGSCIKKEIRENKNKAKKFRINWTYQKVLESWLKFVVRKNRKIFHWQQAGLMRNKRILSDGFKFFAGVVKREEEFREKCLKIAVKKKKIRVFHEWKRISFSYRNVVYPDKIYFIFYLWLGFGRQFNFGSHFKQVKEKKQSVACGSLEYFIKKSLLNTWKQSLENVKKFKKKLQMKNKLKIFHSWSEKTKTMTRIKSILNPYLKAKKLEIKEKIFKAWAEKYLKIILNKSLYKQFSIQKNKRILISNLKFWRSRLKLKIRHNRENQISKKFMRKTLLTKYLESWNFLFRKTRKKSELSRLSQIFFLEKYTLKPWNLWRKWFLEKCKKDFKVFVSKTKELNSEFIEEQEIDEDLEENVLKKSKSQKIVNKKEMFSEPTFKRQVDSSIQTDSAGIVLTQVKSSQNRNIESKSIFVRPKFSKLPENNLKHMKISEKEEEILKAKDFGELDGEVVKEDRKICVKLESPQVVFNTFSNISPKNRKIFNEEVINCSEIEKNTNKEKFQLNIEKSDVFSVKSSNLISQKHSEVYLNQYKQDTSFNNELGNYLQPMNNKTSLEIDLIYKKSSESSILKYLDEKSPDNSHFISKNEKSSDSSNFPSLNKISDSKSNFLNEKSPEPANYDDSFRKSVESPNMILNNKNPESSNLKSSSENAPKLEEFKESFEKSPESLILMYRDEKSAELNNKNTPEMKVAYNKTNLEFNETRAIQHTHSQQRSSELKTLEEKSFDSTSPLNNQENEEDLKLAISYHHSFLLQRFFTYIKSNTTLSKQVKSRVISASLVLTKFMNSHLELSAISTLQQVNVREIRQNNRAKNHKRRKTLKKILDFLKKRKIFKFDLLQKYEIILKNHKKLEKKRIFLNWVKTMKIRNYSKDLMIKYHFLLVKDIFSKWLTELKIKEIQSRKTYQLKVFSLAGLQIYAEKTFHAKAHLNKAKTLELAKVKKKVFSSWKDFRDRKLKSKFFRERFLKKLKQISVNAFKDYHIQSLIEKEIQGRCYKNLIFRYVHRWRLQLKRKLKLKKLLKKILIHRFVKVESLYLLKWQQIEMISNKTVIVKTLRTKKINKEENLLKSIKFRKFYVIGKVFYAWDQFVSDHSIKRRRNFIYSVFMGWKLQTRENALLRKYLIESNLSEKYLQSSVEFTGGLLKSMSSLSSFQSINFN